MKNIVVRLCWYSARIYDHDRLSHLCRDTIAPTSYRAMPTKAQLETAVKQYAAEHSLKIVKVVNERH